MSYLSINNILIIRRITLLYALGALFSGCSFLGDKAPFQTYNPRIDCVSCKKQEDWGFSKRKIYRHNKIVNFAGFQPKAIGSKQLERIGLCYGTAIDTIKSGATHFRILDKEIWGDWHMISTPAIVTTDLFGTKRIYSEGKELVNRDQSGIWWANHYYEIGSPDCESLIPICSYQHKFDLKSCPYEGENLRRETEEKRGTLACVMKHNPRLLLHEVYYHETTCGHEDRDRWIPADDVIKKYGVLFKLEG